jgi:hypothetical protein
VVRTVGELCRESWMVLNTFQRNMLEEQLSLLSVDFGCTANLRNVFRVAA